MKDGFRFVDCDMHIMEPMDLFDKYLDPEFKPRVTSTLRRQDGGSTGMRGRPLWFFDGQPLSNDGNVSQYNRIRGPLVSKRANTNVMFAVERGYDAEAQVIGMAMEGGEKEVGSVVELLGGADNICVSSDFPHFDSSFPDVSTRVMTNPSIRKDIAGKILSGGARLYGFAEEDLAKADAAAKRHDNIAARA